MSRESRKAELEKQYQEQLKKLEEESDDDEEYDGDVIILRGKARDRFLEKMEKAGFSEEEAEEVAEEVEEEVEEGSEAEPETKSTRAAKKSPAKKVTTKTEEVVDEDPAPPSRHRYFG